jgi:hypothetical protein
MKKTNTVSITFTKNTLAPLRFLLCLGACCAGFALQASETLSLPGQQTRLELMKTGGVNNSLTLIPVRLGGRPFDRVTEVVGLLLEKNGLKKMSIDAVPLQPSAGDLAHLAGEVEAYVKKNPISTQFALYAEFNGDARSGLNELRGVVVDKAGQVVWAERLNTEDTAMQRLESREPMTFCVLLCEELGPALGLNEDTAKAAKPGKFAALMDQRSGLPSAEERGALPERQRHMKAALPHATLVVYPPLMGLGAGKASVASTTNVARLINQAGICQATAETAAIPLRVSHADPNELKALWDLAREFRTYLKAHPPQADYALCADYAFDPGNADHGFVHFVVCDRKGEWVLADLQNSEHADYQGAGIISEARCDALVVKRLGGCLR